MFDARSLLDNLMQGGNSGQPGQGGGAGSLGDILSKLSQPPGQGAGASGASAGSQATNQGSGSGGLGDILAQLQQQMAGHQAAASATPGSGGTGLGDLFGKLQEQLGSQGGGGLMDVLGQVLSQATAGVKEGAQQVDQATGASDQIRDALAKATGKSPEELINQLKDFVSNNRGAAGAIAGGLGAIVLGTQTGRALAGSALKVGALALIGGLAYKAVQNYQQGRPPLDIGQKSGLVTAPQGSGYEATAVTHDAALLYIRAMIAAAAADGRIDATEQQKIMGSIKQAGLDGEAQAFLAKELRHPATPQELAQAVKSDQEAVQLFTAARIAVDPDNVQEHTFLVTLAHDLGLDDKLVAHVDAAARAA